MDVSNRVSPDGQDLIQTLVTLTAGQDLCENFVRKEIGDLVESAGHSNETLTLDQLRHAIIAYLQKLEEEEALQQLSPCVDSPESSV